MDIKARSGPKLRGGQMTKDPSTYYHQIDYTLYTVHTLLVLYVESATAEP